MSCPVDPTAWGKKNRVTLYPGKVNRWVLARTLSRDNPSPPELLKTTIAVMGRWFLDSGVSVSMGDAGDAVDSILIVHCGYSRPPPSSTDQRRDILDPAPTLTPGPLVYLTVEFNYRGTVRSMAWPVWSERIGSVLRSSKICPLGADWMLVQASSPTVDKPLPDAPTEPSWWSKLDTYSPGAFGALQSVASIAGLALGAYVAVNAWRLLASTKRRP